MQPEDPKIHINDVESQKEIARVQRIALSTADALHGKISDVEMEGLKLAKTLGFDSMRAAQSYIDIVGEQMSYKELAGRIAGLQTELSKERKANQKLLAHVQVLMTERDALKAKLSDSTVLSPLNATRHSQSETLLQRRYDDLLAAKLSAEARYAVDYRKFKQQKTYMRSAEIQDMQAQLQADLPMLNKDEKIRRRNEIVALTERKIQELEAAEDSKEEILRDDSSASSPPSAVYITS
ncbi:hypothetical protein B0H12DRAFT_1096143 [Mycena haematopus]|nr:hypothetical protein B0H12DRAFT_1096143 [Mycena haematopus]